MGAFVAKKNPQISSTIRKPLLTVAFKIQENDVFKIIKFEEHIS